MKKYLILQMVPSIWENIFGLLSLVSVVDQNILNPIKNSISCQSTLTEQKDSETPDGGRAPGVQGES